MHQELKEIAESMGVSIPVFVEACVRMGMYNKKPLEAHVEAVLTAREDRQKAAKKNWSNTNFRSTGTTKY